MRLDKSLTKNGLQAVSARLISVIPCFASVAMGMSMSVSQMTHHCALEHAQDTSSVSSSFNCCLSRVSDLSRDPVRLATYAGFSLKCSQGKLCRDSPRRLPTKALRGNELANDDAELLSGCTPPRNMLRIDWTPWPIGIVLHGIRIVSVSSRCYAATLRNV